MAYIIDKHEMRRVGRSPGSEWAVGYTREQTLLALAEISRQLGVLIAQKIGKDSQAEEPEGEADPYTYHGRVTGEDDT